MINLYKEAKSLIAYNNLRVSDEPTPYTAGAPGPLRMYVLVRRDILPMVHVGVQAAHAVSEYVFKFKDNKNLIHWVQWDKTMIVLEATKDQIDDIVNYFDNNKLTYACFKEPDLNNTMTAVAFEPCTPENGKILFKGLNLVN